MPLGVLLTLAAAIGLFMPAAPPDRTDRANPTDRINPPNPTLSRTTPDFWNSAHVPDPGGDIPISVIRPEDLGVVPPTAPVDHPARIALAINENDLPAIQSAALSWFEHDPTAVRDWLAMQPTYDDLQPAISYIASGISEKGDLNTAIEWTKLLPEGTLRDDTIFDIHALALRNGRITVSQIALDEIPPERRSELLSGAAGD